MTRPKKEPNVMDERCVAVKKDGTVCNSPPTIRDLMGGDGMTHTKEGPICADCYLGIDVMDPNSPGRIMNVEDQNLMRSGMPESISHGSHAEFIGAKEKIQIDKKMREFGINRPKSDLLAGIWSDKRTD